MLDNLPVPAVITFPRKIAEMIRISKLATWINGVSGEGREGARKDEGILIIASVSKCRHVKAFSSLGPNAHVRQGGVMRVVSNTTMMRTE
jgi:hypothetical protein